MKFRSAILTLALGALAPLATWSAEPAATTPAASEAAAPAAANAAAPAAADDAKATATAKADAAANKCDVVTGTRIRPAKDQACVRTTQPTRSFSKEEIDMTGEIDVADALRKLDPIFH